MSLNLGACFNGGILLASDSFVFDNNEKAPSKALNFNKIMVSEHHGLAMIAVGSRWVFCEAHRWLTSSDLSEGESILSPLADKWRILNQQWKKAREEEMVKDGQDTLRPVSDSLLILARSSETEALHIIDSEGQICKTNTFVTSGSGADIVRQYLQSKNKLFRPTDSLADSLALMHECFRIGGLDLYVSGFPTIAIITNTGVIDLSSKCQQYWQGCENRYFALLSKAAISKMKER